MVFNINSKFMHIIMKNLNYKKLVNNTNVKNIIYLVNSLDFFISHRIKIADELLIKIIKYLFLLSTIKNI